MRLLSLKIATLASLLGLIFILIESLKLFGTEGSIIFALLGIFIGCPMMIANMVVYAYIHDRISDGTKTSKTISKQGNAVDCVTCGTLLKGDVCSNCGTR